jgi:replication factor C small subunit
MEKIDNSQYMLVEKYRPQTLNDMILPQEMKNQVKEWLDDGRVPNLLLSSISPGLGKTTLVQVISNELDAETLFINASLENGIDILRSKIADFASSCSFDGSPKIVILDEADNLNKTSTQPAFRGFLDEFSKNCTFIFTCNYQDKLIEPLKDRLVKFNFDDIFYQNKKEIGLQSIKRLKYILENEDIEYNIDDVKQILLNLYPGLRDMTMYIQNNTRDNVLHISDNLQKSVQYKNITDFIKHKDFTKMRQEVAKLTNPDTIYTWMWNNLDTVMEQPSQPEAILIIAKYQFQAASAVDKELNACAMCTELMGKGNIKWL